MATPSSSPSASRSASRDVSRASSPSLVASASAPRRTVRSKATTPAPPESPEPAPKLDDIFQMLENPLDVIGAFVMSPVADAENFDRQALSSAVQHGHNTCKACNHILEVLASEA